METGDLPKLYIKKAYSSEGSAAANLGDSSDAEMFVPSKIDARES